MAGNMGTVDKSSKKLTDGISAFEVFNTPRVEGEPDLVVLMTRDLTNYYCEIASAVFMSDPEVLSVTHLNPVSQRIIINRWAVVKLLQYRDRVADTSVNDVLSYVIDDGGVDDWLEAMQRVVLPFFKERNVLNILPGE